MIKKGSEILLIIEDRFMKFGWDSVKANPYSAYKNIVEEVLEDKVVVPEEKWESKEEHTEKLEGKLKKIKALIENSLRTKQENLKLYNPSEPIYAKMCGEMEVLEKLKNEVDEE